jgi:hypothetical protein
MQEPHPAAGWWGYAEVDRAIVGLIVAFILGAAIIFLVRKFWRR